MCTVYSLIWLNTVEKTFRQRVDDDIVLGGKSKYIYNINVILP